VKVKWLNVECVWISNELELEDEDEDEDGLADALDDVDVVETGDALVEVVIDVLVEVLVVVVVVERVTGVGDGRQYGPRKSPVNRVTDPPITEPRPIRPC